MLLPSRVITSPVVQELVKHRDSNYPPLPLSRKSEAKKKKISSADEIVHRAPPRTAGKQKVIKAGFIADPAARRPRFTRIWL